MKVTASVLQLIACANVALAFSPSLQQRCSLTSRSPTCVFSSQWEDEDEEIATTTSFEDAGDSLRQEEDKDRMDGMGDFDANPAYNAADIERVRNAIKDRADAMGIEKSKVSAEAIAAAQSRAQAAVANRGSGELDLSQITQTAPRGENEDEIPAMFYEPEQEMTDEEMKEADPDGYLSIPEQVMKEVSLATWPTPLAALKEAALVIAICLSTAFLVIQWDEFLRNFYTGLGFIPRPEDVMSGSENMVLPEGWTNGMNEADFMNFQDEVAKGASAAASSFKSAPTGFPEL